MYYLHTVCNLKIESQRHEIKERIKIITLKPMWKQNAYVRVQQYRNTTVRQRTKVYKSIKGVKQYRSIAVLQYSVTVQRSTTEYKVYIHSSIRYKSVQKHNGSTVQDSGTTEYNSVQEYDRVSYISTGVQQSSKAYMSTYNRSKTV
jgi:hypothetical protein